MVWFHSFTCGCPIFLAPFAENTVLSPLIGPTTHVKNYLTTTMGLFLHFQFYFIDIHIYPYPLPHCWLLLLCSKFWNWKVCILQICFFLQDWLEYLRAFEIPQEFQDQHISFCKEASLDSYRDCTISIDQFVEYCHLNNVSLHEYQVFFQ